MTSQSGPIPVVCLARLSAIGDVALAVPAVYSLCHAYPGVRFLMLTRPAMVPIFTGRPANLEVMGVNVDKDYAGPLGMLRLARTLRRRHGVGQFIDLHNVLRTKMLGAALRLMGVGVTTLRKDRAGRRALTAAQGKERRQLTPSLMCYAQTIHRAGYPFDMTFAGLYTPTGRAGHEIFDAVSPPKAPGEKWLGVAPFAAHPGKIYPPELMFQALETVIEARPDIKIYLFGGGGQETRTLQRWARRHPKNMLALAGRRLGFDIEMAIMSHLDAMVAMDSGNMHLAALTGVRVITLWGATHPLAGFTPWNFNPALALQRDMDCRPCSVYGKEPCRMGQYPCLQIPPGQVAAKILTLV